jgi:hypothetical protein
MTATPCGLSYALGQLGAQTARHGGFVPYGIDVKYHRYGEAPNQALILSG